MSADGRLLGRGRRELATHVPAQGLAEHDPRAWLDGALAAGADAVVEAGGASIDAVGIAGLGPAPVLVDDALEPLTPALLFALDTRAEAQRLSLPGVASHDHALPKLLWWASVDPGLVRRAAFALDATGYLVARLTGVPTMDAITAASYVADDVRPPVAIPAAVDPLAIAGHLLPAAAARFGLAAGTPVIAGTLDTYVDVAAAGAREPGDACVLLGSTLVLAVVIDRPLDCEGLEQSAYPGGGLLLGGWTAAGGSVLDWFRHEFGGDGLDEAVAALEPGAGGLVALPYLAGERTPVRDPRARGLLLGLTLRTTRAQAYRALVDALALAARDHLERFEEAGVAPPGWRASGGGTRNEAWAQATADALGAALEVCAWSGEAVGPAILALRGIGVDPDRPTERVVLPDPARQARFEELYEIYRGLHPLLAGAMDDLGSLDAAG